MRKTVLTVRFEILKDFRRKRFYITASIALFISLIFSFLPLLIGAEFPRTGLAFAYNNLNFLGLLILISGAIYAGDAISGEFDKKTGLILFPTPQRRITIILGKYVAAYLGVVLSVTVYFISAALSILVIYGFGSIPGRMISSYLLALLYSLTVTSIIFLFSSFMKKAVTSSLVGLFLLMLIMPIIAFILRDAGIEPWFMVTYSANLITSILDFTPPLIPGQSERFDGVIRPDLLTGIAVMAGYAILSLSVAVYLSLRRTME